MAMEASTPFGTQFSSHMAVCDYRHGSFGAPRMEPVRPIPMHPAAHALHYGSACFEGLKAHRGVDGVVRLFRADRHVERMRRTAALLCLPIPPHDLLQAMITETVQAARAEVPDPPGALYVRPVLVGTEPNIGAAATPANEALLYVLASPVGDYFAGGPRPLRVAIETDAARTTPRFGEAKCGANYVMALGITEQARAALEADQVLFAPAGAVEETGASNFLLLNEHRVVTPALSSAFLPGVTRDSVLALARDRGYDVDERPDLSVDDVLAWVEKGEAALSGTAAILAGVGTLIHQGTEVPVGTGEVGATTRMLRAALTDLQTARSDDPYGWVTAV